MNKEVLAKIQAERDYQIEKWGGAHDREHSWDEWGMLFAERVGKMAFAPPEERYLQTVILAALCVAALEATIANRAARGEGE